MDEQTNRQVSKQTHEHTKVWTQIVTFDSYKDPPLFE